MDTDEPRPRTRLRSVGRWALVVAASLLLLTTILGAWVNRQVLDRGNWTDTTDALIADPDVQDALATFLVDELYANVDVAGALADRLPTDLQGLAGPASAALRAPATSAVERLLASGPVQTSFSEASSLAHDQLVKVLEDDGTYISTSGGVVTLELRGVVVDLGTQLGVPESLLDRIPPDAGRIELARSDELAAAQVGVAVVRWTGIVLGLLAVALYVAAVLVAAPGSRRRALRTVGWAVVGVGLAVAVARRVTGNLVVGMVSQSQYQDAARSAYDITSGLLRQIAWVVIVWGVVLVLGAFVAGPTRAAIWVRAHLAPLLNRRGEEVALVVGGAYVLLLLWAPLPAFQAWVSAVGLGILLAVGTLLLRRMTLAEHPDASFDDLGRSLGAVRTRLGSAWTSTVGAARGRGRAEPRGPTGGPDGGGADRTEQLQRLADLHDRGALDDGEFARAKADLLGLPAD